jgi:carboxymethylenebutenolidase
MRRTTLIVLCAILFPLVLRAQPTCCSAPSSATDRFAAFVADAAFVSAHAAPLPYRANPTGWMVNFGCSDGRSGTGYFVRSESHPEDVVIVVHEWWGLNDYIKSEADKIGKELGVSVLAVDLYDGKVATTPEDAGKYVQAMKPDRAVAILGGAIKYLGTDSRIATVGWCFGGGWSHQAALLAGKQAVGCVMYYGMPEMDQTKLKGLNCSVLGIFGKKDKWINAKVVAEFQAAMKKAGKKLTVYSYDADHAFANPSNPNHDEKATADAWKHAAAYLRSPVGLK